MNNLKDIHNSSRCCAFALLLFYQDFNEQFEGYTQLVLRLLLVFLVVLSGFQWTIWRIYTTKQILIADAVKLFYQDFNEQFEGYTQPSYIMYNMIVGCFIRISMNNLKDIHNYATAFCCDCSVVLSGFQWTIWRIYTTIPADWLPAAELFYQDFNEQFEGYTQP